MANFFSRLFKPDSPEPENNGLEKVQGLGDFLEKVPPSEQYPEYLLAPGNIIFPDGNKSEIYTAINIRDESAEFSTNVGQLPASHLGGVVTERLNHTFDGKFVTFPSDEEEKNKMDLVYTSRKDINGLDESILLGQLKEHAIVKETVTPILNDVIEFNSLLPEQDYFSVRTAADRIVDKNLNLFDQLGARQPDYLPQPKEK